MDPLEHLDLPWDTSLCLLRELARRGHETVLFIPTDLGLSSRGTVYGSGRAIRPLGNDRYHQAPPQSYDLKNFDVVLIRKDPPFDASYLSLTYLLEPAARKTRVINHPRGIRNVNEKLFGLSFPQGSPPSLVTARADEILNFQKRIRSDLVIKPLYEKGGKGVFLVRRGGRGSRERLEKATRKGNEFVIAQKFIKVPRGTGDKRILLWKGEILGAFSRVSRTVGEFRTNLSLGGRFLRTEITRTEKKLVRSLAPLLLKEGLYFVGMDVRGGKLLEVNVTSPAGLVELDQLYHGKATVRLADALVRLK